MKKYSKDVDKKQNISEKGSSIIEVKNHCSCFTRLFLHTNFLSIKNTFIVFLNKYKVSSLEGNLAFLS